MSRTYQKWREAITGLLALAILRGIPRDERDRTLAEIGMYDWDRVHEVTRDWTHRRRTRTSAPRDAS